MMITVVDDHEFSRENLKALLGLKGYRVVGSTGRGEALGMIKRNRPDLVVVSLSKPEDATGMETDLKSDPALDSIPVVKVSQPVDTDALVEKIRTLLEK